MISRETKKYIETLVSLRQQAEKICEEKAGALKTRYRKLLVSLEAEARERLTNNVLFEEGDIPLSILGVLVTTDSSSSSGYSLCPLIETEVKCSRWNEEGVVIEENRPMQLVVASNGEVFSFEVLVTENPYCGILKVNNVAVGSRATVDDKLFLPVEEKEIDLIWGSLWYAVEGKIMNSPEQLGRVTRGAFKNHLVPGVEIDFPPVDLTMGAVLLPQEEDFFNRINQAVIAQHMPRVGFHLPSDSPYQGIDIDRGMNCHMSLLEEISMSLTTD